MSANGLPPSGSDQGQPGQARRKSFQRWVKIGGSLLAVGLYIVLLARQDWRQVFAALRGMPWWTLPVVLGLLFSGLMANAFRWYLLLRSQKVPVSFFYTLKIVVAGQFASNFLPSTIGGDALRIVSILPFAERTAGGRLLAAGSVVLDRALNVGAMLTFLPFAWLVFGGFVLGLGGKTANRAGAVAGGLAWLTTGGLKKFMTMKILVPLHSALPPEFWEPMRCVGAFTHSLLELEPQPETVRPFTP